MHSFARILLAATLVTALAACNGGGSQAPLPPSTPVSVMPMSAAVAAAALPAQITLSPGAVIGADNQFTPNDGDIYDGGQGQTVAGIPCLTKMFDGSSATYHVHAFLGILVNGKELALPDGIGMKNPGADVNGYVNSASCFYYIHTHDASGMLHIESPSTALKSASLYTLGNAFSIWGISVTARNVGPYTGTVRTYVATVPLKQLIASNYTVFSGDPHTIKLYSHEAIWLEVGPTFVTPPPVRFYTEY
ncbi:MAG: hypothetical protein ACXWNK_09610 [Vulcanimicrobiaceae bacterium]